MCILYIVRVEEFSAIACATHFTTVESYSSYVSVSSKAEQISTCVVLDTYQGEGKNKKNDKICHSLMSVNGRHGQEETKVGNRNVNKVVLKVLHSKSGM